MVELEDPKVSSNLFYKMQISEELPTYEKQENLKSKCTVPW